MKRIRRIASLLLAMVMVFGLTATAFAAETTGTGQEGEGEKAPTFEEHTYTAYKILDGTLSLKDDQYYLVDITWGDGVNHGQDDTNNPFLEALKADDSFEVGGKNIFADAKDAEGVANALNGYDKDTEVAKAFARVANKHKASGRPVADGDTLPPGYYLVVDTTQIGASDAYNFALLQVVDANGVTIEKKYDVPTVDKSVKATDDADGVPGEAVDVSIGDKVTFTLKGTLPDNYEYYEKYSYQFNDTLSAGLDYQETLSIKLYGSEDEFQGDKDGSGGTALTKFEPAKGTGDEGATTLTWTFTDLKTLQDIDKDSVIVVTYTAILNSNAVPGSAGNPNEVTLTFSNDPSQTGEGDWEPDTSTTPPDKVLVFTYALDGTKIEKKTDAGAVDKPLAGAKFVLYRGEGGADLKKDADGSPTNAQYAQVTGGRLSGWTLTESEATVLESDADGKFKVEGLDAGDYYLKETEAPAGYNMLKAPVKLTIAADTGKDAEDVKDEKKDPVLTELTIMREDEEGNPLTPEPAEDMGTGAVSLKIENSAGVLLPSTGGMGTTLFYIVGAALVLAAGALLVMKRRAGEGK